MQYSCLSIQAGNRILKKLVEGLLNLRIRNNFYFFFVIYRLNWKNQEDSINPIQLNHIHENYAANADNWAIIAEHCIDSLDFWSDIRTTQIYKIFQENARMPIGFWFFCAYNHLDFVFISKWIVYRPIYIAICVWKKKVIKCILAVLTNTFTVCFCKYIYALRIWNTITKKRIQIIVCV